MPDPTLNPALAPKTINATTITANSIIENMNGYSFIKTTETVGTYTDVYAAMEKTGNRITFVIAGWFTRTGSIADYSGFTLGNFVVPSSIWNKLVPFDGNGWLISKDIEMTKTYQTIIKTPCLVVKNSNNRVGINIYNLGSNAELNQRYYIRVEFTFLLGSNLAS